MAQHKARSRIAQFKQPFLLGTVTSAALLAACGGKANETDAHHGGLGGNTEDCPAQVPAAGDDCGAQLSGESCNYEEGGCSQELKCESGKWVDRSPSCNPPPPETSGECPEAPPVIGQSCALQPAVAACEYDDVGCLRRFVCNDGEWADQSPTCNPPPPRTECPAVPPKPDEDCTDYAPSLACDYEEEECPPDGFVGFICDGKSWGYVFGSCNPPSPQTECPAVPPAPDEDCADYELGLVCEFVNEDCPLDGFAIITCNGDSWEYSPNGCNPPPPEVVECPTEKPPVATDCSGYLEGLECEYDTESSCPSSVRCTDQEWENTTLICNPPPPDPLTECPVELPIPGDDCSVYETGLVCEHHAACDGGIGAACGANGIWEPVRTFCNPPPPETDEEPDGGASSAALDGG